jgi:orotidine-5'-phosphate decarboxylase
MTSRLIAAIDTADLGQAGAWVSAVAPHCGLLKFGLEFYLRHGAAGLRVAAGAPVFLDLKLHDIPNTVAGAVRALGGLDVRMLTVHAGGGNAMVAAAVQAAAALPTRPLILAVTVLTSLDASSLSDIGVSGGVTQQVLRLARLALGAGADGVVCSAREVPVLRDAFGPDPVLVVPGIRPAGAATGDQARVMTPVEAITAGASYIVVGRPITTAANPAAAAAAIAAEIAGL